MFGYHLELTPDDNGTFVVTSRDFPEVTTFGETKDDACRNAVGAIEEAIAARMHDRQDMPSPIEDGFLTMFGEQCIALPALTVLKIGLYQALKQSDMTRADLARALGWHREQVDRLFRLDHASRIDQIEAAFAKLGKDINIEIRTSAAA
jgi:antitoxin HicB